MAEEKNQAGVELGKLRKLDTFVCAYCKEPFTARARVRGHKNATGHRFCSTAHRASWHQREQRAKAKGPPDAGDNLADA